jgi:hypothetical protein
MSISDLSEICDERQNDLRAEFRLQRQVSLANDRRGSIADDCLSKLRLQKARCAGAIEDADTGRAELQPAPDKTGNDAAFVWNILLAEPHDVGHAGGLILLGLGERRTGCQYRNHGQQACGSEREFVDVHESSPCDRETSLSMTESSAPIVIIQNNCSIRVSIYLHFKELSLEIVTLF